MQKIELLNSKRVIVYAGDFESNKDHSTRFKLKYVVTSFEEKDWKLIPIDSVKSISVSKKSLGAEFEKMDNEKICQELIWKSILMTTFLWD